MDNVLMSIIEGILIVAIIGYIIEVIPKYLIAKKADLNNPELMFVPILGDIKMLNVANISGWAYLINLIPFAYWILLIVRNYKIFTQFDFSNAGRIVGLFFSFIALWFIAVDNKTPFTGVLDEKYRGR
ncbi:MAG: hypothetical protein ACRC30_15295 [Clostridium sp.]